MLEDDSNITSETLQTMNYVAKYFRELKAQLESIPADVSFAKLLAVFTKSLKDQML